MTKTLIMTLAFLIALSAGPRAYAVVQQQVPVPAMTSTIVLMNADTAFTLPSSTAASGGPPWPMGYVYKVFDNNGSAGASNITVSGKCASGTATISTNYGSVTVTWTGTCWQ